MLALFDWPRAKRLSWQGGLRYPKTGRLAQRDFIHTIFGISAQLAPEATRSPVGSRYLQQNRLGYLNILTTRLSCAPEPRLLALIVRYENLNDAACGACCVCRCDCDVVDSAAATSQPVRLKLHMMRVYEDPFGYTSHGGRFAAADGQCR